MAANSNPVSIYGCGVSYLDVSVKLNSYFQELLTQYDLKPEGKYAVGDDYGQVNREIFQKYFNHAFSTSQATHGGSSGNTICTIQRLLGHEVVRSNYQTVIDDKSQNIIGHSFRNAGVDVVSLETHSPLLSGSSLVIVFPDGKRTIITDDGNASSILAKESLKGSNIRNSDVIFLEGSLWQKIGKDSPDQIMDWRWKSAKQLWLSLPTKKEFASKHSEHFQFIIPSTNILLGNLDELAAIYHSTRTHSLECLRQQFCKSVLKGFEREPIGFITDAENGFYSVTKDGYKLITGTPNDRLNIINRLGAGDTALAGAVAAYIMGLSNEDCCRIGNFLAEHKICNNDGAQVLKPRDALHERCSELLFDLLSAIHRATQRTTSSKSHYGHSAQIFAYA